MAVDRAGLVREWRLQLDANLYRIGRPHDDADGCDELLGRHVQFVRHVDRPQGAHRFEDWDDHPRLRALHDKSRGRVGAGPAAEFQMSGEIPETVMLRAFVRVLLAQGFLIVSSSGGSAQSHLSPAELAALAQHPAVSAAIEACSGDRWRLCGGVIPGGGRIVRCLAANEEHVSQRCQRAMAEVRETIAEASGYAPERPSK